MYGRTDGEVAVLPLKEIKSQEWVTGDTGDSEVPTP